MTAVTLPPLGRIQQVPALDWAGAAKDIYDVAAAVGRFVRRLAVAWLRSSQETKFCTVLFVGPVGLLTWAGLRADTWESHTVENLNAIGVQVGPFSHLAVLAAVVMLAVCGPSATASAAMCPRMGGMGDDRWRAALHEAGHLVFGRHQGHRTGGAVIRPDGSGGAAVWWKGNLLHDLAMSMAGAIAEGRNPATHYQSRGDRAQREGLLQGVPRGERLALESKAERLARQKCRQLRGQIRRTAEKLYEHGHVS